MRIYKILSFVIISFLMLPVSAWAHTGLESSSPSEGEIVTTKLSAIKLEFNTEVERLSTITITGDNQEEVPVSKIMIKGSSLTGELNEALTSGNYTVTWKIVGTDGHPIQGGFPFTVQLPVNVAPPNEEEAVDLPTTPAEKSEPREDNSKVVEQPVDSTENQGATQTSGKGSLRIGQIAFILFLAAGFFSLIIWAGRKSARSSKSNK